MSVASGSKTLEDTAVDGEGSSPESVNYNSRLLHFVRTIVKILGVCSTR